MVLFALIASAMLGVVGLLYSFGLILSERRALQTAADAASLGGTWVVLNELASDDRSDATVRSTVAQFATSNGADPSTLTAVYVDGGGSPIGRVGATDPFPATARGVRVDVSGQVPTVLPGFLRILQVLVQDTATAAARPTTSPARAGPVIPVAIPQTAYAAHATFDLFAHPPGGARWATLDFASNGLGAPDFGSPATNEQFWSDGQHLGNWQLSLGASINLADAPYYDSVAAGLRDNVRRQALVDAAGRGYAIVMAPVYDTASPASAHVVGFVQLKIVGASITASSAPGLFVPYAAAAYGTPSAPSPDVGASVVGLIS